MSVVLVLEPEDAQAEYLLRVLRKRLSAETVLVTSTASAIEVIGHAIPDLILVSALLSPRDEDRLMAHLRSLENAAHLQMLTIPQLAAPSDRKEQTPLGRFRKKKKAVEMTQMGCDPDVFAQEVSASLAQALEIKSHPVIRSVRRDPVPDFSSIAQDTAQETVQEAFEETIHETVAETFEESAADFDGALPRTDLPAETIDFELKVPVEAVEAVNFSSLYSTPDSAEPSGIEVRDTESVFFSFAADPVQPIEPREVEPDRRILGLDTIAKNADEVEVEEEPAPMAVTPPVAQKAEDLLARLAHRFGFGSEKTKAPEPPPEEAAPVRPVPSAPAWQVPTEVDWLKPRQAETVPDARVVDNAPERLAAQVAAAEAEARLAAEVERVRAEGEAQRLTELAQLQAEADIAREAAIAKAREEAERLAAQAAAVEAQSRLAAEVQRVRAESEAQRLAEVARLKAEADAVRNAAIVEARADAERLAAQAAAVEAESRLAAELERVRAEGEAHRLAEVARLQAEADIEREAAIVEARTAAEREAREALAAELTRARSEAEGVFAADLARVRAEVEERLSAQVEAAETRLAAAEEARSAAEAEAAAALESEVARVRGEAEARLQAELERIRADAEAARIEEQSHAKYATRKIREAAAREAEEARALAEAAAQRSLEAEMARVRAQADKFLQDEVSRVRADAQERQAAELQELRAQMAEIRDTAAKTAAEQSADYYKIWQPAVEAAAAADALPPAPATEKDEEAEEEDAVPVGMDLGLLVERHIPWLKWAVPTAACMLFIANIGPSAKPAPAPAHAVESVEKPFVEVKATGSLKVVSTPAGARLLVDGRSYGQTPVTIPNLEPGQHTLVLRVGGGSITRKITIRAGQTAVTSEAIFSGWIAVYSAVPMTVSLNGKPAAAGSDGRIMTPPGTYEVAMVNDQFNYHGSKTLEVRPGEVTAYTVVLPSAPVHILAPEGADITVDGSSAGRAPVGDLLLPLGTHEVTATTPDAGKRGVTIAVRYGETTQAKVE